jgi:imidazole glycerol-phosphate synthase subunit HisF
LLLQRLIPSLLVQGQRLVKGSRFQEHRDAGRAETTARAHNAQGADELLLLDIDASRSGKGPNLDTVRLVARECFMPLTVGGGIRSMEDARACMEAGADKICLTTTAMDNPLLITDLARLYGSQATMVGIDVVTSGDERNVFDFRQHSAGSRTVAEWMREVVDLGAGEIKLMSVDREGMREGLDLELLEFSQNYVNVPVILEGGAGSLAHVAEAMQAGADAVALGTMLVFSDNNIVKIKRFLSGHGGLVRV